MKGDGLDTRSAGACPPRALECAKTQRPPTSFPSDRGMARDRPSPYGERETALHTVARGPSDAIRASERVSPAIARPARKPNANQCRFLDRGMARDRPSPYGETETALQTVARGPVPRERTTYAKTAPANAVSRADRGTARDRPSPHAEGDVLRLRNPHDTVARGPVPRERWNARTMARDRPSPYVKGDGLDNRSAGACPPRALECAKTERPPKPFP